jgi:hypothetical protein
MFVPVRSRHCMERYWRNWRRRQHNDTVCTDNYWSAGSRSLDAFAVMCVRHIRGQLDQQLQYQRGDCMLGIASAEVSVVAPIASPTASSASLSSNQIQLHRRRPIQLHRHRRRLRPIQLHCQLDCQLGPIQLHRSRLIQLHRHRRSRLRSQLDCPLHRHRRRQHLAECFGCLLTAALCWSPLDLYCCAAVAVCRCGMCVGLLGFMRAYLFDGQEVIVVPVAGGPVIQSARLQSASLATNFTCQSLL